MKKSKQNSITICSLKADFPDYPEPLDQPLNTPIKESGDYYILVAPYTFTITVNGQTNTHTIPTGFRYDGASVPRWATFLTGLRRDGVIRGAATIHDWLYENKGHIDGVYYPRDIADLIFLKVMEYHGLKSWRAGLAHWGVDIGGRKAWRT